MNLGEFHTLLRNSIGRGTSQDTSIPDYTRRSVRWIERNNTFQYMRRWVEWNIDPDSAKPYLISIYDTPVKRFDAVRYIGTDGRFHDLNGPINPKDRTTREAGYPSAYWLDGVSNLVLDSIPEEEMSLEGHLVCFSKWPTEDEVEHWLLDNAEDVVLARAMMYYAISQRDERMYNANKTMLVEGLQTLAVAEHELVEGPQEVIQTWSPMWDELGGR